MSKMDVFMSNLDSFRKENKEDHGKLFDKVDDLAVRVTVIEFAHGEIEKHSGRILKIWCAIIGAVGIIAGGAISFISRS